MSHFDDIAPVVYSSGGGGGGPVAAFISLVIVVIAIIWAVCADNDSKALCEKHGEKYVDSRSAYTLCERKDGSIVRR